jgi:hypothetical protein
MYQSNKKIYVLLEVVLQAYQQQLILQAKETMYIYLKKILQMVGELENFHPKASHLIWVLHGTGCPM